MRFDEYHGEAQVYRAVSKFLAIIIPYITFAKSQYVGGPWRKLALDLMRDRGMLERLDDGRLAVRAGDRMVTVSKSDGASLYFTRDVAAVLHRVQK